MVVAASAGLLAAADGDFAKVDFAHPQGVVKPVNGVGQPPILGFDDMSMFHWLKEAGIPYSRLHDVGGPYGKNIFVDIPNVFRDFDADENDPGSYDFDYTDLLMKALVDHGVEPYFRLGVTIENAAGRGHRAYRIFPPKDYAKWARICEHVVRHYTEGWADGFRMKVSHWEIWNEPENAETIERNCMWKAPFSEYIRLYVTAAAHLKAKFPHLRIGGYASCGFYGVSSCWANPGRDPRIPFLHESFTNFLAGVREAKAPLDFFSFHCYDRPSHAARQIAYCRRTLDDFGFARTEMSLNEWMPCAGAPRKDEDASPRQTAEIAAMLCVMQNGAVDDAEIYDARCGMGLYSPFFDCRTHGTKPAYAVYLLFNELRKLGAAVPVAGLPEGVFACAATDGKGAGAVLVANTADRALPLRLGTDGWTAVSARLVDAGSGGEEGPVPADLPAYGVALVRCRPADAAAPRAIRVAPRDPTVVWNRDALYAEPKSWRFPGEFSSEVTPILLEGEPFRGKPTTVFAYYGVPKTATKERPAPAIVLVHGGLGTSYPEWVRLWVRRGYAAICVDTCGALPVIDPVKGGWVANPSGGPRGWGRVDAVDEPERDQWTYHAVAAVIRSHSFLRSLPNVDARAIGVTGVSWGGILSCIAAAADDRFAYAVPVYGCGFTFEPHGQTCYDAKSASRNSFARVARWAALWDPSAFLPFAKCPFLWVDGTNDFTFSLDAVRRSAALSPATHAFSTRLRMPHGHGAVSEAPAEILAFADRFARGGADVVRIGEGVVRDGTLSVRFDAKGRTVVRAELLTTADGEDVAFPKRRWCAAPVAALDAAAGEVSAKLPAGAFAWFVNLVTDDGLIFSSPYAERSAR